MANNDAENRPRFSDNLRWSAFKARFVHALDRADPPERLAASFAVGVFCGMLPFPGHTVVVTALAFPFRLNLAAGIIGAWVNFPIFIPFTFGFAFFVGKVVTGADIPLIHFADILDVRRWWPLFTANLIPMATGTTIVGTAWAVGAYFVALRIARRLRQRRHRGGHREEIGVTGEDHEPRRRDDQAISRTRPGTPQGTDGSGVRAGGD